MPPFKSPKPRHNFTIGTEKTAITRHFTHRQVPKSRDGRLLLATWNIANLGAQNRTPGALALIAHILQRFDLIAVQEVNDDFKAAFIRVMEHVGSGFDYIMSDTAGNNERLVYVYRTNKVTPTNLCGELALRKRNFPKRTVKVRYSMSGQPRVQTFRQFQFEPFDRNPFIASFEANQIDFTLVNVHLYFGKFQNSKTEAERRKYARRVLEIVALARWAEGRYNKTTTYDRDIVLLGDMNVPAMDTKESTYKEIVRYGWKPVKYVTKTGGSNLGNDRTYDQMTFAPRSIGRRVKARGVFDFDKVVFKPLWERLSDTLPSSRALSLFNRHVKHHLSDHRPLWVELDTT
jgi:endonuclease/exonuclease/phosphatase family metal-dependent hydrolase